MFDIDVSSLVKLKILGISVKNGTFECFFFGTSMIF